MHTFRIKPTIGFRTVVPVFWEVFETVFEGILALGKPCSAAQKRMMGCGCGVFLGCIYLQCKTKFPDGFEFPAVGKVDCSVAVKTVRVSILTVRLRVDSSDELILELTGHL